ncbi:hypothetical protein MNEG_7533 [Monoraphidium neglectum]|uniref:Uncharacterized protein n=1 Tax=Monoraphidium neglectum TaxID=145388 RepID=A0A0D2JML8_9CHLO|nr:hypothetical protein MNEG_7533 [Monoraphidium neglectum]KIZ00433.1 hypothetical protein MNEG_7533 [Monoraphidium neglectum]|eukprot:XP_013899452.1 hypothetical protein MNEG_7533 [Monoraphidium neglectum]
MARVGVTVRVVPSVTAALPAVQPQQSRPPATLRLRLSGGVSHDLPWPPGPNGSGAAAFEVTTSLAAVAGQRLKPFDAYTLALSSAAAVLETCHQPEGSSGGTGIGSDSSSDSDGDSNSNSNSGSNGDDGGGANSTDAARHHPACTSVQLPVHIAFVGSTARGFRITTLPALPSGAAATGSAGDLLVSRETSQRTLRLMALIIQWAFAGYALAWATGALMSQWVMRIAFARVHSLL